MIALESFAAIDFETTGAVQGYPVEPWQIGVVRVTGGSAVCWETLLRVGPRPFHPRAPGRHEALRTEIAAAPDLRDCVPDLRRYCGGVPLVAHNAATEKKCLRESVPMEKLGPYIDTLKLSRAIWPDLPSHALGDVLAALGLTGAVSELVPGRGAHDALYDAAGSAVILRHILGLPELADCSPEVLFHPDQAGYYRRRRKET